MISSIPLTKADLEPFADVGTSVDGPEQHGGADARWILIREGETLTVTAVPDGSIFVDGPSGPRRFGSPATMLADPIFGDLVRWAKNQTMLLPEAADEPIPIRGLLKTTISNEAPLEKALDAFEEWLRRPQGERSRIVVIDGPAGIGKTTVMRRLALHRAKDFTVSLAPLILHIESRGKALQSVTDLMASALQDLRSHVTYLQAMPLIRHGLVTLAIDGFDELVDPSGYDTAWGQLNELVMRTRGRAAILLAGRETMVSLDRVEEALTAVQSGSGSEDTLSRFTLMDPRPDEARRWLGNAQNWTLDTFNAELVQPIFEKGSYALRPFFLAQIGPLREQIEAGAMADEDLLVFLVRNMLEREASKFGENLEKEVGRERLRAFVRGFLQEVARELAESQTTAIALDNLRLCAEVAASTLDEEGLPLGSVPNLVNRAEVIAFLTTDTRPGYRRFAHEQLSIHFLSEDCIRSVGNGEVPKYIRRNIWGFESLEGFTRVARTCSREIAERFATEATKNFTTAGHADRTRQNLAALGVIVHSVADLPEGRRASTWSEVGMTELLIPPGEAAHTTFREVVVSILHVESADLRAIVWKDASVITLHVDYRTVPTKDIKPAVVEHTNGSTLRGEDAIAWIVEASGGEGAAPSATDGVSEEVLALLGRIERYRSFWLRDHADTTDRAGRRIITDPTWPRVREVLRRHGRLVERNVSSAGVWAPFVHFLSGGSAVSEDPVILADLRG